MLVDLLHMDFTFIVVTLWSSFLQNLHLERRRLLEHGTYFGLIVKWNSAYLRPGTCKRKYGKTDDAQYSQ